VGGPPPRPPPEQLTDELQHVRGLADHEVGMSAHRVVVAQALPFVEQLRGAPKALRDGSGELRRIQLRWIDLLDQLVQAVVSRHVVAREKQQPVEPVPRAESVIQIPPPVGMPQLRRHEQVPPIDLHLLDRTERPVRIAIRPDLPASASFSNQMTVSASALYCSAILTAMRWVTATPQPLGL
jgi:hypothetical protein